MMEQELNDEMRDKLTKVCICKNISRKTIKDAIKNGAKTIYDIKQATGAGTGHCGGRRCGPKIQSLLMEAKDK